MVTTPSPEVSVSAIILIDEGRVRVLEVDLDGRVLAKVRGTSEIHTVRRSAAGRWTCTCWAGQYGRACRHREAVRLVT